ncbi:Nuclease-related domain-containing protein [Thermoanaerobacter thermohydrosulfuricus]|uniref:Nuclease-related domain-containing protein n=1 Tax=Thermoanaerobacter thermohydrosulfuricus TaxID=1516 RepID=A0A1G7MSW9_THETY|nr:nuclease-related domain-containing protein [Thermoanaerobacter thermohydrosulfuricus]SDF64219.1 Nuclease-related domain-containing protein [Thermoanaerobacter thermohydrosulfuricus]
MLARTYRQNGPLRREFYSKFNKDEKYFKGKLSELASNRIFRFFLPRSAVVMSNIVLPAGKNSVIEIDHIIISKTGIYIIEEKNWRGTYYCGPDSWYVMTGYNKFKPIKSPEKQHERHYRFFIKWMIKNGFGQYIDMVKPTLLLNRMEFYHSGYIKMNFYRFPFLLLFDIYDDYFTEKKRIPKEVIDKIAQKLAST